MGLAFLIVVLKTVALIHHNERYNVAWFLSSADPVFQSYGHALTNYRVFPRRAVRLAQPARHRARRYGIKRRRHHPIGIIVPDRYSRGTSYIFGLGIRRRAIPDLQPGRITNVTICPS